ncbi:MAG: choice-of-anchor D domain-containing protein, partial [bacterium]
KNAALQILSNDPDEETEEVPLTGDGCAYPDIAVDPSLWDFNLVDVGDFEEILIVVSNLGCQMLEVTATSIVGGDPDQFVIVSGGGPFTIAQGQTHDMLVRFRPTSGGSKSAVLQIVSNDADENIKNVSLNGEGCSYQDVSINPTSWNYGTVDIGSFQDKTFVLSNLGCQILQVTGVELVGPDTDQFSIVDGHGAFTLVQGERRNMVVRFGPTSGGSKTVTLQITSNDPDEATLQVQLSGGVCLEPDIGVNPTSWDFSTVNVSQHTDKPIVVSNTGCQLLEVSATNIVGPDAGSFSVLSGGGAFTVVQGETDSVVVRFAPTSGGGKSATLQIVSNDPDEGTKDISLSGTGCSQPDIALDPPSWNYDQVAVGDHADRIFVVANGGCQDLVVSGTAVVGSDAAQFAIVSGGGPFTVVQGGAHSVVVRFSPTDGGAKTASFQVHSNDPDEEEYSVPLTGSAVAPDIALSDTSHDFDGAPIDQPQYWILEISNVGDGDLTVTSISSDRADFAVSYPTFPQTVLPGEFISVAVVFIPSVTGLITGSLTIASNDLDEPTLSVSLRGLGLVPDIELSETSHNFGGVVVGNATEWILTVTNMGTGDLVVRTIGSDNPVFAVDITSFTVEPGGSQLVTVTFGPTAAGLTSGLLTIFSSDPDEPVLSVVLTGEGLVPDIEVVTSHNFGDVPVGNFAQWTMTVSNVGTGTLVVSGVGSDNPDFTVAPTSFTVVPGGSRDVVVTFTPSQGEAISGQITVVSNDPDEPMVTVYVMGNGLVPDINIPVASYDFGGVLWGDSATWNLDVQNVGPGELFVTDIASDNPDFGVDLITFTLIPGASQSVGITFVPSTGGPIFGQLVVSSNDPDEPTVTVGLTGTGLVPDIDISATSHTFENVPVGQSSDWILTVFNVGTGDLEVKDVVSNSSDFRVDITAFSVVPNLSRDVTVTFTPSTEGLISGQLTIYSNDPDEPTVGVMVSGAGLVPDIEIPTSFDFGEVGTDSSAEWTLLIENVGGADLIVNDVRSDNAAFTVTSPPLPLTIGPGSSQSVPVTFAPSDSEIYNGKLTITSNDPDEPKLYISLTGIGIPPVSVQLNSFVALAHEGVVLLRWTVGAAKGCMGFHVYRSSSMDGVYERLTRSLIPVVSGAHTYRDGSTSGQGFYYYRLGAVDLTGREEYVGVASVKVAGLVPGDFGLAHNYPNPFNPETRIAYTLPEGGRVTLAVYNTLGQKVKRLVDGSQSSGRYAVLWDGRDDLGQDVPSGIYIAVLRSGTFTDRKKMVLLK